MQGEPGKINKVIGEKIRQARIKASITQKQLGKYLGFSQNAVVGWEKGTRSCKPEILFKIARILKKDFNYFFSYENEKELTCQECPFGAEELKKELEEIKNLLKMHRTRCSN